MNNVNAEKDEKFTELLASAERVLAGRWGAAVRLGKVERLSEQRRRNLLLRCEVLEGPADAPHSVMVKRARQRKYDPDDSKSRSAVGLFRDWAGLEFLGSLYGTWGTSPEFYGGDREAGFFVMEDLGASEDLDHVLTCGCAESAHSALLMLAEVLGRMHALTAGRGEEYQRIRDALGPGDEMQRQRLSAHILEYAPRLVEHCKELGVEIAAGFLVDVETVADAMADPGEFLAYTHADACPDNCVLVDGRLRLIDFEFGSFRHALLDGVYGWMRFPTCWCVRDIPEATVAQMETVYRRELVKGCPAAEDDVKYYRGVADACAYWMLENLSQLLERALRYEEPKGTSTNRQRILIRLAAFQQVAERAGHLESLRQTLGSLLDELRRRWRDDTPKFDAFGVPAEMAEEDIDRIVNAIREARTDHVNRLLEVNPALAQTKVHDEDQTPVLFLAMETKNAQLVQLLLDNGADWRVPTRSGWTVLSKACSHATPKIVDLLLERGADLNKRDVWGTLPLYGTLNNRAMMVHLLKRGAMADLKMAIDMERLDIAQRILEEDSTQARICYGTGLTLLHDSARVGDTRIETIDLLLSHGADINAVTNWGATPLHLAVFHGNVQAAAILIESGSQLLIVDDYGLTALAVAEAKGQTACAELLRNRMGDATQLSERSTVGFHTAVVGATFARPEQEVEEHSNTCENRIAGIDEFYNSLSRTRDDEPHPMDDLASALLFENLKQRKKH